MSKLASNSKPLRILVAHNVSRERYGGMSRFMGFTHDQISECGHSVDYLCSDEVSPHLSGWAVRFWFPLLVLKRVLVAARAQKPYDIVNVHEPSGAVISLLKRTVGNLKVVAMSHGPERRVWEVFLEEGRLGRGGPSLKSRLSYPATTLWQCGITLRHADHILCRNSVDRDYLVNRYAIQREKLTIIPAGAGEIYATKARDRQYSGREQLLFAGSWLRRKGVQDLTVAFNILALRHSDLTLKILGAGVPEGEIREQFDERVRSRVRCVEGPLADHEHAAEFAQAHIFMFPTLSEGATLTVAEAMMSGLPIVATDVCGMTDLIHHEENGLLVPIRTPTAIVKQVERLLEDQSLRSRIGRAARADALENYTWARVGAQICQVYEHL
jgi:glycosyltransferase involved in cell wall biosynthesis